MARSDESGSMGFKRMKGLICGFLLLWTVEPQNGKSKMSERP